jgi:hypothetical protein
MTMVGLIGDYSKHDAQGLRRLVQRLESAPKRPVSSTDEKIQARRLDRRLSSDTIAELVDAYRSGASTKRRRLRLGSIAAIAGTPSAQARRRD